jgi:hypothetical protein
MTTAVASGHAVADVGGFLGASKGHPRAAVGLGTAVGGLAVPLGAPWLVVVGVVTGVAGAVGLLAMGVLGSRTEDKQERTEKRCELPPNRHRSILWRRRTAKALESLLTPRLGLRLPKGPAVLWLDDLKPFLDDGVTLLRLREWHADVTGRIVAATYGGKGSGAETGRP